MEFLKCRMSVEKGQRSEINPTLLPLRENIPTHVVRFHATAISFPESSFPLTSGRKTRALGATILGEIYFRQPYQRQP